MSMVSTMPGTLTKVTPDNDAPIMPKATTYHGDWRLPRKKASLPERPVSQEIKSKMPK